MGETVILFALIIVLFLITVCSIIAIVRLRKKTSGASSESLDAGFDICISELNKMGNLIKSDVDAKYKEILFLYSLIEDKHKQVEALVVELEDRAKQPPAAIDIKEESVKGSIRPHLPDHVQVLKMSEQGIGIADIAKELGIGQGEVRLILSIASA